MFLLISLVFGIIFIFVTQPFRAPDEPHHFSRIISFSQGHLIDFSNAPKSYIDFMEEGFDKAMQIRLWRGKTPQTPVFYDISEIYKPLEPPFIQENQDSIKLDKYVRST
ncbi:MAG: hypothetical protein WCJ33_04745, partial [Pseudomonadota bacterium]